MLEDLKDKIAEEEDQWKNFKIEKIIFLNNNKKYKNLIKLKKLFIN